MSKAVRVPYWRIGRRLAYEFVVNRLPIARVYRLEKPSGRPYDDLSWYWLTQPGIHPNVARHYGERPYRTHHEAQNDAMSYVLSLMNEDTAL